jgi:hypothetical protein
LDWQRPAMMNDNRLWSFPIQLTNATFGGNDGNGTMGAAMKTVRTMTMELRVLEIFIGSAFCCLGCS